MTFKEIGLNREVYRRFIEESGIKDSLSEILYRIFELEEKPKQLETYVRQNFGTRRETAPDLLRVRKAVKELESRLKTLREENNDLKKALSVYREMEPHYRDPSSDGGDSEENDRLDALIKMGPIKRRP